MQVRVAGLGLISAIAQLQGSISLSLFPDYLEVRKRNFRTDKPFHYVKTNWHSYTKCVPNQKNCPGLSLELVQDFS